MTAPQILMISKQAVQRLATSLTGGRLEPSATATDAARGRLRLAEDALSAARGAKRLIEDQAHYARQNLSNAQAAVHRAALATLADEALEGLLTTAVEARANYVASVGELAWLLRHHAVPGNDARARQLVAGADIAPSAWGEAAAAAEAPHLTARLAALEGGAS